MWKYILATLRLIEWSDKSKTHLVNFGSLDNNKIFLIDLLENEKQVIDIKILDL